MASHDSSQPVSRTHSTHQAIDWQRWSQLLEVSTEATIHTHTPAQNYFDIIPDTMTTGLVVNFLVILFTIICHITIWFCDFNLFLFCFTQVLAQVLVFRHHLNLHYDLVTLQSCYTKRFSKQFKNNISTTRLHCVISKMLSLSAFWYNFFHQTQQQLRQQQWKQSEWITSI